MTATELPAPVTGVGPVAVNVHAPGAAAPSGTTDFTNVNLACGLLTKSHTILSVGLMPVRVVDVLVKVTTVVVASPCATVQLPLTKTYPGLLVDVSAIVTDAVASRRLNFKDQFVSPVGFVPEPVTCDVAVGVRIAVAPVGWGLLGVVDIVQPLSSTRLAPDGTCLVTLMGTWQVAALAMSVSCSFSAVQLAVWK